MNVISGKFKGRKLIALEGRNTRPTIQYIKEDMFNILDNWFFFENKKSLDLFGGSGALSLEGVSRGILHAYINDLSKDAVKIIEQNFHDISKSCYSLFNLDYKIVLTCLLEQNITIDLIYFDPPFANIEFYYDFFEFIKTSKLLNNFGVIICESPILLNEDEISQFVLLKYKNYKNKHLYILRREDENND
ncbi:RsmD family RNA methyltransferase [Spiroplasma endosymbiont of Labia minor]|uniref:RsmD family RNA methyltransferase n=1 Tax=Spiroplasma endosymbiont of Labia minor TaxID=3066305 RepID=UPI0030CC73B2